MKLYDYEKLKDRLQKECNLLYEERDKQYAKYSDALGVDKEKAYFHRTIVEHIEAISTELEEAINATYYFIYDN